MPFNVLAGKKIFLLLSTVPKVITLVNSSMFGYFIFPIESESGFWSFSSLNSAIIFSFHSSLCNCQIPKNIVSATQNKLNKKNFIGKFLIYAPQT